MSKQKGSFFWSRMIITCCLAIWAAVVFGNWISDKAMDKFLVEKDSKSAEISLPSPTPRPWVEKAPELQREVEGKNGDVSGDEMSSVTTIAPVGSKDSELTVTPEATPAVLNNAKSDQESKQEESVSEDPSQCSLFFGAFKDQNTVEAKEEKLREEGIKYKITDEPVEDGVVHRITAGPYANREAAQKVVDTLRSHGVDVYIEGDDYYQ